MNVCDLPEKCNVLSQYHYFTALRFYGRYCSEIIIPGSHAFIKADFA